jgi:ketosteroid isomerase-like protein
MKRIAVSLILISILLLGACNDSNSKTQDRTRVEDMVEAIRDAFNNDDIEAIMAEYHPDFLHNGRTLSEERQVWQARMIDYSDMMIDNLSVEVDSDDATASFKLSLTNLNGTVVSEEPRDHGDVSFFRKDDGTWKIIGNLNYSRMKGPGRPANSPLPTREE